MDLPRLMRKLGWLLFTLMWIPFITLFIGMAGLPDGSYSWSELPALSRMSLIGVGILGGISVLLLVGSPILGSIRNRSVLANGQLADATIVDIQPTGTTVNNYYVGLSFLLDVRPMSEPPFQARAERLVPMHMMAKYQAGAVVKVKFDPQSKAVALTE